LGSEQAAGTTRRSIVVLADPDDRGALLVARSLRLRGAPVALVATDQLLLAPVWEHDPLGASRVVLGNGLELTDSSIGVLFCRARGVDPPQFRGAVESDRRYAQEEFFALLMSWLARLGERVLNRPHPGNLHGTQCSLVEDLLSSAWSRGSPHGFAAASHARHLPPGAGPVREYRPWGGRFDAGQPAGSGVPGSVVAGGPGMRLPPLPDGRHWNVTVIGDRLLGGQPPAAARSLAFRLVRDRGLSFAAIELFQLADGGLGHGMIDPFPALDHAGEIEAAADHLALALSMCVA
jgi:hypothetical protein